ncbi:MAG: glycosyltransferase family 2 protein [bacterium]|nr:glycosyltransferase family 2 protein [bacterium]
MRLSVVIPAYNEEHRLEKTLRSVDAYLKRQDYEYEIIVVSDGSTDGTFNVGRRMEAEIRGLKLISNELNHGKGYVVRQGMLAAQGEFRLFMDADNATTIDHVERMWPKVEEGAGVIICSRDIAGSVLAVAQPWWRQRLGDIFNIIVQATSGLFGIWDTQCGFKGFTAKAAEAIFPKARIDRWAFDVELLVIARNMGFKIVEVPVTWVNDPDSKVKLKGMVRMLYEVVQIRLNTMKGMYAKE